MNIYRVLSLSGEIVYTSSSDGRSFNLLSGEFPDLSETFEPVEVDRILAPIEPPAVYIIGYNYAEDPVAAREKLGDDPVVVMKAVSTVIGPEDPIPLPPAEVSSEVDYEGELAVVVGRPAKNLSTDNALDYVYAYAIANDLTARDLQRNGAGGQWVRGKNLDGFCPLGPSMRTADSLRGEDVFSIKTFVNGELRQDDTTASMIFSIPEILVHLSAGNTLLPGTVILTGTPAGTGVKRDPKTFLQEGDRVRIEIDLLGALENSVVS